MPVHELIFLIEEPADRQASVSSEEESWVDELSDALLDAGALSVSVEDPMANQPDQERPLFGEPGSPEAMRAWPVCRVAVHLEATTQADQWWAAFIQEHPEASAVSIEHRQLEDQDWVSLTQRQFEPILVGLQGGEPQIWVGPSWTQMPEAFQSPPRLGLVIDPGMAFGTGGHATTQLCLMALLQAWRSQSPPETVLDVGTGSGILALAAAHLGALRVVGVDIDPVAVSVAKANWAANPLNPVHAPRAAPATNRQDADWSPDFLHASQPPEGRFDLVVANILAQPLRLLAPLLWSRVAPEGSLVLSGILSRQADMLIDCYAAAAPDRPPLQRFAERDGWVCLAHLSSPHPL